MAYEMNGSGRRVAYRGSLVAAGGLGSLGDDTDGGGGVEDLIHGIIDPITGGGTTEPAPPAPDGGGVEKALPTVIDTQFGPPMPGDCPDQYKFADGCHCPPGANTPEGGCYYVNPAKPGTGVRVNPDGTVDTRPVTTTGGRGTAKVTPVGPMTPDVQEASMWSNPLVLAAAAAVVGVGVLWYAKKRKMAKAA